MVIIEAKAYNEKDLKVTSTIKFEKNQPVRLLGKLNRQIVGIQQKLEILYSKGYGFVTRPNVVQNMYGEDCIYLSHKEDRLIDEVLFPISLIALPFDQQVIKPKDLEDEDIINFTNDLRGVVEYYPLYNKKIVAIELKNRKPIRINLADFKKNFEYKTNSLYTIQSIVRVKKVEIAGKIYEVKLLIYNKQKLKSIKLSINEEQEEIILLKNNLKTGMKIETVSGEEYIVYKKTYNGDLIKNNNSIYKLNIFTEDLKCPSNPDLDIVKIVEVV